MPPKRKSEGDNAPAKKKAKVDLTKHQFVTEAQPLKGVVGTIEFELFPKVLGTGSVGWSLSKRLPIKWRDTHLLTQVSLNCTAIGSKDWPVGDGELPEPPEQEKDKNAPKCETPDDISRPLFSEHAVPVEFKLGTLSSALKPKLYDSGSCGWFFSGRLKPVVANEEVQCMVTLNATVVNSNQWPKEKAEKAEEEEEEEAEEEDEEEEGDEEKGENEKPKGKPDEEEDDDDDDDDADGDDEGNDDDDDDDENGGDDGSGDENKGGDDSKEEADKS